MVNARLFTCLGVKLDKILERNERIDIIGGI